LNIPTLAWASQDDHIVNFDLNTKTLIESAAQNTEQGAAGVAYGDHCGFASAYGFSATTAVLQTFVLNNSPEFKKRGHIQRLPIPIKAPTLSAGEIHLRQWWSTDLENQTATLFFETFSKNRSLVCRRADPFESPESCRKTVSQTISLSKIKSTGLRMPGNQTEAEVLTRQLNHLIYLSHKGQPIDGTKLNPTELSWTEYQ
jgi:hypothetical protein